jgi:hypothetical protein
MVNEYKTPDDGISIYVNDPTQGPAVALTAIPGTYYRNYNVTVELGNQFNALKDLYIDVQNGYLLWKNNEAELTKLNENIKLNWKKN